MLRWRIVLIIAAWTAFGLLFSSQSYLGAAYSGKELTLSEALVRWMPCGYAWAALTPLVLILIKRVPFDRTRWKRALAVHLPASLVFSLMATILYILALQLMNWSQPMVTMARFKALLAAGFHIDLLIYGMLLGITYAVDYYHRYSEREILASQLQTQLAQAQLAALKSQLHPHFLFNTLNTIAVLMDEDTKSARKMLVHLSDLLRAVLQKERLSEVSLREEMELLESYLQIERMRFHDRLNIKMSIDSNVLDARVPDLVLQPLVENAIKYGIATRTEAGRVEIRAGRENGQLCLEVRDDGPGMDETMARGGSGLGLANTRARLEKLYGEEQSFEIRNAEEGGLVVSLTIPFKENAA